MKMEILLMKRLGINRFLAISYPNSSFSFSYTLHNWKFTQRTGEKSSTKREEE